MLFVFFTLPILNFPYSCRFLLYPHHLLALCDYKKNYYLLANCLLVNRQCWSNFCILHKGEGSLLNGWSFPFWTHLGGKEGNTFSMLP